MKAKIIKKSSMEGDIHISKINKILDKICADVLQSIKDIAQIRLSDPDCSGNTLNISDLFLTVFANCYVFNLMNILQFSKTISNDEILENFDFVMDEFKSGTRDFFIYTLAENDSLNNKE